MARKKSALRIGSQVVHAGQQADPTTGAVMQPVYLTSTYRQPGLAEGWPYEYARKINPTRSALERQLAELEGGRGAQCFSSGMAAISAVIHLSRTGDHVIVSEDAYGGTRRLFEGLMRRFGLEFSWVDTGDPGCIEAALRPETRMIFVETPTNPTLRLVDLKAVARLAQRAGARLVVDNTFMTPVLQRPLEHGADLVVHSTTKYLNGHSDSIGGAVISARKKDVERLGWIQNSAGAILSPLDSFLVLRGVKTLALRMARHEATATVLARWLESHPAVDYVNYPGLKSHPQHGLARRQMDGYGGVISFDVGSLARAKKLFRRVRLCQLAESLGGVESLISHPATMTHASVPAEERERVGVRESLVRLSVGIEDPEDLREDLDRALAGL
jgi:cystathionine beta-lyase/cystathionine gamma-synthase